MHFGFDNISVSYGRKQVLGGVTLEVPKGSIMTLIGPNGCGKSTLLKTVSRAVRPSGGRVICDGRPITEYPKKELARRLGYLAQVHTSPPDIDVRTLVSYGRYPYMRFGRPLDKTDTEAIDLTLEETGLKPLEKRTVSTLSGGERQRAWIAMTVCRRPDILILDEPTTYLDIACQLEVLELVRRLNKTLSMTVLMVLHDLNMAARYSDLLAVLGGGRVTDCGKTEELFNEHLIKRVFGVSGRIIEDKENGRPFFISGRPENNIIHDNE